MTIVLPFDILVLFAQAGGDSLAVTMAATCRPMKRRMDERYIVSDYVHYSMVFDKQGNRRPGITGKFVALRVSTPKQARRIPNYVTHIQITKEFPIPKGCLPENLVYIQFFNNYSSSVEHLPENVQHIELGDSLLVTNSWPRWLTKLKFGYFFDQDITHIHLPMLRCLQLGDEYDRFFPCDQFPNLEELEFGYNFNQPLTKLPRRLRLLKFGIRFNQPLPPLPETLRELILGHNFQRSVQLPEGLTTFRAGRSRKCILPSTLTHYTLPGWLCEPIQTEMIPPRLIQLGFNHKFDHPLCDLPNTLQFIRFGDHFNQPLDDFKIPSQLTTLIFGKCFNQHISSFPESLEHLEFGDQFNQPLVHLPSTLKRLILSPNFQHSLAFMKEKIPHLWRIILFRDCPIPLCCHQQIKMRASGVRFYHLSRKNCEHLCMPRVCKCADHFLRLTVSSSALGNSLRG